MVTCFAIRKSVFWVAAAASMLLTYGCTPVAKPAGDVANRKIRVVSTVGMIDDVVRNVGGERVDAIGLMGAGVDPHLYRATADDVGKLEGADVIFYGGLELEGRMTDIFVKMAGNGKPTFPVTEGVPVDKLREPPEFHGKYDPHVWFDVTLWQATVPVVTSALQRLDPGSKELYRRNADAYDKRLQALHAYVTTRTGEVPKSQRVLVTAHDAFGYFGRQYGFEVLGIQGTSTATEAAASTIIALADTVAKRRVKAIFVETSVSTATIDALQKAVRARGWDVKIGGQLFSDAMGAKGSPEGTYEGMVRHNVDTIVTALR